MMITDINVSSFGKFSGFKLEFKENFNLIYGPNEAGKSTLLTFLEFMLFGAKQDGRTRKYFLDSHEKYQPWQSDKYEGFLRFRMEQEGRLYEVYRNFLKDKDTVSIHDATLGKDLSGKFSIDKRDEILFAQELLGLSRPIFLNTIMIPQLALKDGFSTDSKELSAQIIKSLSGTSSDKGTDDAIALLDKALVDGVGKTDRGKRAGELVKTIEKFEKQKEKALEHRNELTAMKEKSRNLGRREKTLDKLLGELEQKKAWDRKQELEKTIDRAQKLSEELKETKKKAEDYIKYQHFPLELSDEVAELERKKNDLKDKVEEIEAAKKSAFEKLNASNLELMPLDNYIDIEPELKKTILDLKYDWRSARKELDDVQNQVLAEQQKNKEKRDRYEELKVLFNALGEDVESQLQRLELGIEELDSNMMQATKKASELSANTGQNRAMTIASTFFALIAALGAILFAIWDYSSSRALPFVSPVLSILASVGVAGAIYFRRGDAALKKEFDGLQATYEKQIEDRKQYVRERSTVFSLAGVKNLKEFYLLESEYQTLAEEMANSAVKLQEKRLSKLEDVEKKLRRDILGILHEAGLNKDSTMPREGEINLFVTNIEKTEKAAEQVDRAHQNVEAFERKRKEILEEQERVNKELKNLYIRSSTKNYPDFQAHKEGRIAYEKSKQTIKHNEKNLEYLLKDVSLSDLKNELAGLEKVLDDTESDNVFEGPFNADELDKTRAQLIQSREEKAKLDGQINQMYSGFIDPAQYELDIAEAEQELAIIQQRRAALNLAIQMIEESRERLHADFAPHINDQISRMIGTITGGRYDQVMTSDTFEISVRTPDSGSIVSADSLSCGTRDQLFFAARLAIANVLSGDRTPLPLFFDDCFVEYDFSRASQSFEILAELAKDRQILFFTCHDRERDIAQMVLSEGKANIIDLSEKIHA